MTKKATSVYEARYWNDATIIAQFKTSTEALACCTAITKAEGRQTYVTRSCEIIARVA